jgi:hypothetical protein
MGFLLLKFFWWRSSSRACRPALAQAMSVEPEPPNGSNDIPLKTLGLYFI